MLVETGFRLLLFKEFLFCGCVAAPIPAEQGRTSDYRLRRFSMETARNLFEQ
jgi:hypothetical protein